MDPFRNELKTFDFISFGGKSNILFLQVRI